MFHSLINMSRPPVGAVYTKGDPIAAPGV